MTSTPILSPSPMMPIEQRVDAEIANRRIQFALQISRYLVASGILLPSILLGTWLLSGQHIQLLLQAFNIMLLASWILVPLLHRSGQSKIGIYISLYATWLAAVLCPLLLPDMLGIAGIGYLILALLGKLLLGDRASRGLMVACIVGFTADELLVSTVARGWFPPLDPTAMTVTNVSIGIASMSIAIMIMRMVIVGQENEFRRAQIATYEVEQRAATEQRQREALEQAAVEIEQRIQTEQQQRQALEELIHQMHDTIRTLTNAASEMLAATNQQVASAAEQEVAITQTAATVEEMRTTALQSTERARDVAERSRQSLEISRAGQDAVAHTINGMSLIRQRVDNIAENILMLSERTQQISEIIDTVNALADQSKLLALNASIEAARAGENGKGFAVVAMEVRQLAEQSRQATARVRDILGEIQQATNSAVMVTEEGSKGAENGLRLVERAGDAIRELATIIEESAQTAAQIAASTFQQTNGIEQLASAMTEIRAATSETAASTRQTEKVMQGLVEMAHRLEQTTERYRG